jgi:hypothetical protein
VTQTASTYSASNPATGAPAGTEISDVVDNADGTSVLYTFNPSGTVTQTASYYSATNPTTGAPAGALTAETFDYTGGTTFDSQSVGSSIATYNAGGTSTQYYSGPDGTGFPVGSPVVSTGGSMSGETATTTTQTDAGTTLGGVVTPLNAASLGLNPLVFAAAVAPGDILTGELASATSATYFGTLASFAGDVLSGFAVGDSLDISDLVAGGATAWFAGSDGAGVLTIRSGAGSATLRATGFQGDGFATATDGHGGTAVTVV